MAMVPRLADEGTRDSAGGDDPGTLKPAQPMMAVLFLRLLPKKTRSRFQPTRLAPYRLHRLPFDFRVESQGFSQVVWNTTLIVLANRAQ